MTTEGEMKARSASAIYRQAAELIDSGHMAFSCCAISQAECGEDERIYDSECAERRAYTSLFSPDDANDAWGLGWGRKSKICRVLALLLMSEIAKDEQ
jgi:hypothetical protein